MILKAVLLAVSALLLLSIPSRSIAAEWYVDASVGTAGDGKT